MIQDGRDPRVVRLKRSRLALYLAVDLFLVVASLFASEKICCVLLSKDATGLLTPLMVLSTVVVTATVLLAKRAYSTHPRYFGPVDTFNLVTIWLAASVWVAVVGWFESWGAQQAHWALPLLFVLLTLPCLLLPRLIRILYHQRFRQLTGRSESLAAVIRTLVIGAGDGGETITRESQRCFPTVRRIVGLIDDDHHKIGTYVHGVKVLGDVSSIPDWCRKLSVGEVLIAMPSASGETIRRIASIASDCSVSVRTLPPVMQLDHRGRGLAGQIREIKIEDLLGREPVVIDSKVIEARLAGATILITGGGGSIGSELARNIAQMSPARLILLGRGENSIFEIQQELIQSFGIRPTCVVADIRNRAALEEVFEDYRPDVVLHAAAHKHVPLMQTSPIEAVENNVMGTRNVAEFAVKYKARKFVYVSTDKAVYPSSVMGATKRVGEMLIGAIAEQGETSFTIVRFGNVLGSRGSVVPIFEKQILQGGPVCVTDPNMTRFFMTIPEAAKLILQSSEYGGQCDIFMLDMGKPVSILSLAQDLIALHGLRPSLDIEIRFTGARPGEKLDEELTYEAEELLPTDHPRIFALRAEPVWASADLASKLSLLESMCAKRDDQRVRKLLAAITTPPRLALVALGSEVVQPTGGSRSLG